MIDKFDNALTFVLMNEGGFVDSPNDSGGATNKGISLRFLKSLPVEDLRKYGIHEDEVSVNTIRDLNDTQIASIYRGEFWNQAPFERILFSQTYCYIFDCCVHHGIAQGIKLVQRAMWAQYKQYYFLVDDGIMGDKTLDVVNKIAFNISYVMAERAGFCRMLAATRPKDEPNLEGWLKRVYRSI